MEVSVSPRPGVVRWVSFHALNLYLNTLQFLKFSLMIYELYKVFLKIISRNIQASKAMANKMHLFQVSLSISDVDVAYSVANDSVPTSCLWNWLCPLSLTHSLLMTALFHLGWNINPLQWTIHSHIHSYLGNQEETQSDNGQNIQNKFALTWTRAQYQPLHCEPGSVPLCFPDCDRICLILHIVFMSYWLNRLQVS